MKKVIKNVCDYVLGVCLLIGIIAYWVFCYSPNDYNMEEK